MAIFGNQIDYELNKSKGVQLYDPKTTKLQAGDVFLGGVAGTGVTDAMLNGAQRVWGADRFATSKSLDDYLAGQQSLKGENQNLLAQLNTAQKTAKAATSKNPIKALIGDDPAMQAIYDQAQQAAKIGGRNAMEEMNARGILNSTVTSDRLGHIGAEAETNVLAQLLQMEQQKRQQAVNDAMNRVNTFGYVDNAASVVLGLPVGTLPQQAKQAIFEQEMAQKNFGLNEGQLMGTYNGQQTLNAQQFAQQKAQQDWENAFNEKQMAADQAYKYSALARSGSGSSYKPTQAQISASNTANAIAELQSAINSGATRSQIESQIQQSMPMLINDLVDLDMINKWLESAQTADELKIESEQTAQDAKSESWNALPWWKKAVDVVIPGDPYAF